MIRGNSLPLLKEAANPPHIMASPSLWWTTLGRAVTVGTLVLDLMSGLGLAQIHPKRLPAIFADFLRLGAQEELRNALQLVGYELVPIEVPAGYSEDAVLGIRRGKAPAGEVDAAGLVPPPRSVLASTAEVQALSDSISHLVEPRPVLDGCTDEVCPSDGARRFVKSDGTAIWVHLDPLRVATDVCSALADVLRRLMPKPKPAAASTAEEPAAAAAAAAVAGAGSLPAAPESPASATLDLAFLEALRVKHTACDSGEDFMIPYELASVADGAQNVFCIPNYYNLSQRHIDYMLQSTRYSRRTYGRIICGGIITGAHVPAHEIVHIVQHFAGQVDRSKHSGQAEHDACRLANALYVSAIRKLRAALSPEEEPHLPPYFLLLGVLVSLRTSLYLRAKDSVDGEAFRRRCRDVYGLTITGPTPIAPSAPVASCADDAAAASAAASSAQPADASAGNLDAAIGGAGAAPAAVVGTVAFEAPPAAAASASVHPVMQIYLDWMASFGLSNPVAGLHAIGSEANEEALKTMCTADATSSCVRQGRLKELADAASTSAIGRGSGSSEPTAGRCSAAHAHDVAAGEGCILRHLSDDATARLLHVCFANRSGDVHSERNRSALAVAAEAQCIPPVGWDSLFELLAPCACMT